MNNIYEHDITEIFTIEKSEICDETLLSVFLNNPKQTIYVTKTESVQKKKLLGIITLGNFSRFKLQGRPLLNTAFIKAKETADAIQILTENKLSSRITSIPIIDDNGYLIKEYYKEIHKKHDVNINTVFRIYQEVSLLSNYQEIIFIIDEPYLKQKVIVLNKYYNTKIKFLEKASFADLIRITNKKNIFVCDFNKELYRVREIFYNTYKIPHALCNINETDDTLTSITHEKAKYYQKIGIWNTNSTFFTKVLSDSHNLIPIKPEYCKWNKHESCYEYIGKLNEIPECIFMNACFTKKPYLKIQDTIIPIISITYINSLVSSYDIAINILPKLVKHQIKYIIFQNPDNEYAKVKELFSKDIREKGFYWGQRKEHPEFIMGNEPINNEMIEELFHALFRYAATNGFVQQADVSGKYANIINGERYTCGNPTEARNTIFFFGPCLVQGNFVADQYTMQSYMRNKISDSYYLKNCGDNWRDMNYKMRNQIYRSGDIVIIFTEESSPFESLGIKVHSFVNVYKRIPNVENHVWNSLLHVNKVAMKYIAEEIYKICCTNNLFITEKNANSTICDVTFGISKKKIKVPPELEEWLLSVKNFINDQATKAGAIVMNCNPFTLGHRYLIETASKEVDVLYIFVVEENKSFFDFKDRLNMVKIGVYDIKNTVVVPSGKYIISTETLPGYFDKESKPYIEFDATEDLLFFSEVIAKAFSIKIRFAGEEPNDVFTNRYNDSMRHFLPQHGVAFREIPRKEFDGEIISASKVRKYIKEKQFEKCKDLVCPRVYNYLISIC